MALNVQFIGKFFDNHSLSIVNRNIALNLKNYVNLNIIPLDKFSPEHKVDKDQVAALVEFSKKPLGVVDIQIRHSYPPIWRWPEDNHTKVVFIQPWEFMAVPSEWQYKFDTFADLLITPSTWTTEVFKNSGLNPERVVTIPNGYNPNIFYPPESRSTDIIKVLYVGCHQFRKGIDILLKLWGSATKKSMPISLTIKDTPQIYGQSKLLEEIIQLQYNTQCASITYDDSIRSEKEMADLYRGHHILVHPYRGEGFGMHIQEAMACGCIPIVTGNGATDDFVLQNRINSFQRTVNMYEIFGIKAEDSMSMMGSYKWVLEPDIQHFAQTLNNVINSVKDYKVDCSKLQTWEQVANQYSNALYHTYRTQDTPKRLA
jgi:glycosyltransferase involved in cell wall biosynthesis